MGDAAMARDDHEYFRRRAVEELEAADRASSEAAAAAHEQLARRYAVALAELGRHVRAVS
jgi:hypothetical protein